MTRGRILTGLGVGALIVGLSLGLTTLPVSATTPADDPSTGPSPTASPSPTPSPTLSPSPSAGPTTSPSPTSSATGSPTDSASGTASGSPSDVATSLAEPPAPGTERYLVGVTARMGQVVADAVDVLGGSIVAHYDKVADSIAVDMTSDNAQRLAMANGVRYVEPDRPVSISVANTMSGDTGCTAHSLGRGDDLSSPSVALTDATGSPFSVNWFGTSYSSIYVNNNGGVAFDDGNGPFTDWQFNLTTATRPMILPLGVDVDTTNNATTAVTYGQMTGDFESTGFSGYCINWSNVGVYSGSGPSGPLISAQLLILNRGGGNVDLVFNYNTIGNAVASSPYQKSFEIGYVDPRNRSNTVRVTGSGSVPTTFHDSGSRARTVQHTTFAGSPYPDVAGRHAYRITTGASPTATPTASATPTPSSSSSCPDSVPAGTQGCATWGLDRIDQRALPLDNRFTPGGTGSGVTAYIVDTGMLMTHTEFTGRVRAGYDFVSSDADPTDCNGHGTHVAGTVGGTTYGVAKSVSLVPIRVLDCAGSGSTAGVVAGINWAITDHVSGPAVLNMSLGGGSSKSIDDAVAAAVADGITVVVAAGNSNADACTTSPAEEPLAITVAATDATDQRASFSNYGSCVDIFAPGTFITSAWYSGTSATATLNGTSMASPHVAGAAAVYLGLHASASPADVVSALQAASTTGVVTDALSASSGLLYARSFEAYTGGGAGVGGGGGAGGGGGGAGGGGSSGGGGGGDAPVAAPAVPVKAPVDATPAVPVPVAPTEPGVIGILDAGFASLPSIVAPTRPATATRAPSGVVTMRTSVSKAAAGSLATLYRGTRKVATARVAADGSITFAGRGIISGTYRVRLASPTKAVSTTAFRLSVPRR